MARLRRTAHKSVPGGPYRVVGFQMPEQMLKNGPFIPIESVDKSTDGDMVIPAHFSPKDPSKYTESEKEKVSLDMVNDGEASEDEPDSQIPVSHAVEQKNTGPQKQVFLVLEEDEYYTLDELDEMDQRMAYLDTKFSNIRVKKPRKPKKVNLDKSYLELEAKYESLLKNQQGKAYIAEAGAFSKTRATPFACLTILFQFRNGIPLTIVAAANFTSGEFAKALCKEFHIAVSVRKNRFVKFSAFKYELPFNAGQKLCN
ncbi:hypothetical protein AgCh_024966 [Apium graveolens]